MISSGSFPSDAVAPSSVGRRLTVSDVLDLRIFRIRDAVAELCREEKPQTWVHVMHTSAMKKGRVRRHIFRRLSGVLGLSFCCPDPCLLCCLYIACYLAFLSGARACCVARPRGNPMPRGESPLAWRDRRPRSFSMRSCLQTRSSPLDPAGPTVRESTVGMRGDARMNNFSMILLPLLAVLLATAGAFVSPSSSRRTPYSSTSKLHSLKPAAIPLMDSGKALARCGHLV